jgi:hypothetical protein
MGCYASLLSYVSHHRVVNVLNICRKIRIGEICLILFVNVLHVHMDVYVTIKK